MQFHSTPGSSERSLIIDVETREMVWLASNAGTAQFLGCSEWMSDPFSEQPHAFDI